MKYDYSLIKTSNKNGHLELETQTFYKTYSPENDPSWTEHPDVLRTPSWMLDLLDHFKRQPYSDALAEDARNLVGDVFSTACRGVSLPEVFRKEIERLSAMPFNMDVADKIRAVIKLGFQKATKPKAPEYAIHSTVRSRHNRVQRAQAAQHTRLKQYILPEQYRLVRGRPIPITEQELLKNREVLLGQQRDGVLEVRTIDGRLVDLETFKTLPAAPVQNTRPNPVLDSVANDIPTGIQFPKMPGGKVLNTEQIQHVVSGMASIDGELKVDPKDGSVIVVADVPEVPLPEEAVEMPHEAVTEDELPVDDLEDVEELPPGIPPPPAPAGGMPRNQNQGQNKKNKQRR